jgi:hypothetical protein
MDILYSVALNLLLKLLLDTPSALQPPPPPQVKTAVVEVPQPVRIPEWVTKSSGDSFVGISSFCGSIEEARQQALHSAIAQIVQNLGAEYSVSHESSLRGNLHQAQHELEERLAYTARWFVSSVNENIKETDIQETRGGYICFVLVRYPPDKIDKLRKLTIGAKAGARIVSTSNSKIIVEVLENNGVEITLTEYEIEIAIRNHHAGVITMFFFKVPRGELKTTRGVLDRKMTVKDGSKTFLITSPSQVQNLKSMLLGTEMQAKITLKGYDELGRPITLPVQDF